MYEDQYGEFICGHWGLKGNHIESTEVQKKHRPQDAEELFVIMMASEAKILQPIARFASVYFRIDYELDPSNRHAIVLQTW